MMKTIAQHGSVEGERPFKCVMTAMGGSFQLAGRVFAHHVIRPVRAAQPVM